MTPTKTYSINPEKAISETLDGETIIINLETGSYYSLNATASELWGDIQSGLSLPEIISSFVARYDASAEVIEKSVLNAISFLEKDMLIKEASSDAVVPTHETPASKIPFAELTITKYEDMQEMLLADPIHDVEKEGWPNIKA